MKKLFLTSAIIAFVSCPSFATVDVDAQHRGCDNATLHTYEGPTSLEADWTANTITLHWYNGDSTFTPNNNTANSCTYDGAITLPSNNPTKDGYTFAGWQVRTSSNPQQTGFDLSTLVQYINTPGTGYGYQNNSTGAQGTDSYRVAAYNITADQQWATEFSYGTVLGTSTCATNGGTYAQTGTPEGTSGQNCWCQAVGFDAEKDGSYTSVASPLWVFSYDYGNADTCAYYCTNYCSGRTKDDADFRTALYSISQ